jgi:hypothetical protein
VTSRRITKPATWRRFGRVLTAMPDRTRPHPQCPLNGPTTLCPGASTKPRVMPGWSCCPPGWLPLGWRSERGNGSLNGGSEEGGLLELRLSLARRASNLQHLRDLGRLLRHDDAQTPKLGV